jgi:predicted double-glycine peptidase
MRRYAGLLVVTVALVICSSCSKNARFLADANLSNVPKTVIHDVVRIPQNDNYSCATTSLAMAITYYEGRMANPIDKETAWANSGTDIQTVRTRGNDMYGLERLANHYGYVGEFLSNLTIPQLEYILSRNVLAVLNIKVTPATSHAILATGYDSDGELLYFADPASVRRVMKYSELENRWSATLSSPPGLAIRSGFLIFPKGKTGFE